MIPLAIQRFFCVLGTVCVGILILGCEGDSPVSELDAAPKSPQRAAETDYLALAKRLDAEGDDAHALEAVYKSLIQTPENTAAKLLASKLEAARGNHEAAREVLSSIPVDSPAGSSAVDLHVQLLVQQQQVSAAADVLLEAIERGEKLPRWRHEAWSLLNRAGRREEASAQAMSLCQGGLATEQELLSLINRTASFPTPEMLPGGDAKKFLPGHGMARWYFSRADHRRALDELAEEYESGFQDAAADALYGRLLAETQNWDEFPVWNAKTLPETKQFSDYWAAVGTFLSDNRRYEAAARALLEAIRRNPTDRLSVQRISNVLASLGRHEDAEQFRFRGIEISKTERESVTLYTSPGDIESRKRMAHYVMELARPFETLAWTLTMLPAEATGPRRAVDQQRVALANNPDAVQMASKAALLGLDPANFDLAPAFKELLSGGAPPKESHSARQEITATPRLVNRAAETDLSFQWFKDVENHFESIPIHESLGGGIAVLDYDLDGWPDLYLAQGSGDPPTDQATRSNQFYRNRGARFQEVTALASAEDFNYSSGLAAGDVNQDGFADLFLGSLGHNRLLINNGDGTFRDATAQLGEFEDRFTTSVGIADISGDGLPELFESNYIEMANGFELPRPGADGKLVAPTPLSHYPDSDRWFENLGDGRFKVHEIDREIAKPGTSLGLVITDFNSDGKNEIFVGNDVRPNHLLVRSDNGEFVNVADSRGLANGFDGVANGCMGIATGDFDRDGRFDLQIANYSLEAANLYLQTPAGAFIDHARRYGLAEPTYRNVGFGTKAVDVDRNGFLDFIVANGHIFDMEEIGEAFRQFPQLLMSDGQTFRITEVEDDSGYWDSAYIGRAIALVDYDRDGATDFAVGHLDQPLALLHDETSASGGWLQLELVGTASERDAIGAKVELVIGESSFSEWMVAGDGYLCSDESAVVFAFPDSDQRARVTVRWPSGSQQTFDGLERNHRYLIVEGDAEVHPRQPWF